jgi:hypothetical protein
VWEDSLTTYRTGVYLGLSSSNGILDDLGGEYAVSPSNIATLRIGSGPSLVIDQDTADGFTWKPTWSTDLRLIDPRVYVINAGSGYVFQFRCSEIEWKVAGVHVVTSIDATGFTMSGVRFTPAGVPVFGVPPALSSSCSANPQNPWFPGQIWAPVFQSPAINGVEMTTLASGGYRSLVDGDYVSHPVDLNIKEAPAGACSLSRSNFSVSTTWGASVSSYCKQRTTFLSGGTVTCDDGCPGTADIVYQRWLVTKEQEFRSGSVTLLPSMAQTINSFDPTIAIGDFSALIYRYDFPAVKALSSTRNCAGAWTEPCVSLPPEPDPDTCGTYVASESTYVPRHARYPDLPQIVNADSTTHEIFDPLDDTTYAPYTFTSERLEVETVFYTSALSCQPFEGGGPSGEDCCGELSSPRTYDYCEITGSFPHTEDSDVVTHQNPYLYHSVLPDMSDKNNSHARYINNMCRMWGYFYYFPADSDGSHWKVSLLGAGSAPEKVNSDDYWVPRRNQYFDVAGMLEAEKTKHRNKIISCPLSEGILASTVKDNFFANANTSWVGISRFKPRVPAMPEFKYMNTQSAYSLTDCTITSFNTGTYAVTLQPSATNIVVEVDLGSFTVEPYMFPHVADRAAVSWQLTNLDDLSVYWVNEYGEKFLFASKATGPGTYSKDVESLESKYAGTWGQDFSPTGSGVIDEGIDTDVTDGKSTASMASAELSHALCLVGGRTAGKIRFEIKVLNPANTVEITMPKMIKPTNKGTVIYETPHTAACIHPDGPGIRWGSTSWWDPIAEALLTTPSIPDPCYKSTALDNLCWSKNFIEGISNSTTLEADIEGYWDDVELGSPATAAATYEAADTITIAFAVPGTRQAVGHSILINTIAEPPPIATMPQKTRLTTTYEATGDYAMESWVSSQGRMYYVNPDSEMGVSKNIGGNWTSQTSTANIPAVSGWKVTSHQLELANDENNDEDWAIFSGPAQYAEKTSPWQGYSSVLGCSSAASTTDMDFYCASVEDWMTILHIPDVDIRKWRWKYRNVRVYLSEKYNTLPNVLTDVNASIGGSGSCLSMPSGLSLIFIDPTRESNRLYVPDNDPDWDWRDFYTETQRVLIDPTIVHSVLSTNGPDAASLLKGVSQENPDSFRLPIQWHIDRMQHPENTSLDKRQFEFQFNVAWEDVTADFYKIIYSTMEEWYRQEKGATYTVTEPKKCAPLYIRTALDEDLEGSDEEWRYDPTQRAERPWHPDDLQCTPKGGPMAWFGREVQFNTDGHPREIAFGPDSFNTWTGLRRSNYFKLNGKIHDQGYSVFPAVDPDPLDEESMWMESVYDDPVAPENADGIVEDGSDWGY